MNSSPTSGYFSKKRKQGLKEAKAVQGLAAQRWGLQCMNFFFFFVFLGPHPQHMDVPRLGVKSELQLPAYTTTTATQDRSHVCNLHHSSWQCQIFNSLCEARD